MSVSLGDYVHTITVVFKSYDEILETAVKARSETSQLEPGNEKAS